MTQTLLEPSVQITQDLARSGLYRLLSLGFRYPAPEVLTEFQRVQQQFLDVDLHLPGIDRTLLDLPPATSDQLDDEYLRLFDRKVTCSPYESEYGMGNKSFTKSRDLADISGFYRAFGLELGENAGELFDHIHVELEFMSVLALKEAFARMEGHDEGLEVTRDAVKAFLREHLGRWAPFFCEKLQEEAVEPFYAALARLTAALLADEFARYEVEPLALGRIIAGAETDLDDAMICPKAITG